MGEFVDRMQDRFKQTSGDLGGFLLKVTTGLMLGLTFALIIHEMLGKKDGEGMISFLFIIVITTGAFWKISKKWAVPAVLIFDLVCILIGIVLRLYIMVAPGA